MDSGAVGLAEYRIVQSLDGTVVQAHQDVWRQNPQEKEAPSLWVQGKRELNGFVVGFTVQSVCTGFDAVSSSWQVPLL